MGESRRNDYKGFIDEAINPTRSRSFHIASSQSELARDKAALGKAVDAIFGESVQLAEIPLPKDRIIKLGGNTLQVVWWHGDDNRGDRGINNGPPPVGQGPESLPLSAAA